MSPSNKNVSIGHNNSINKLLRPLLQLCVWVVLAGCVQVLGRCHPENLVERRDDNVGTVLSVGAAMFAGQIKLDTRRSLSNNSSPAL